MVQVLDDKNDSIPHLLRRLANLMSEHADHEEIDGKSFSRCDEELGTLRTVQKQLERRVVLLSRKRNTFAPISTLPPELLVTIIAIALNHELEPNEVWFDQKTLLLVCRNWNDLVNNTPSLWAYIRNSIGVPNARIIHALKKSKDYPLHIRSSCIGRADQEAFYSAIVPHGHRWRKASLHLDRSGKGLKPMTTLSAPLLESISLSVDRYFGWIPVKPLNIFKGRPQTSLREIFLDGVPIPWSPTVLLNLNALGISNMKQLGPSFDQLLAVLAACPGLESLVIQFVTFEGGTSARSLNPIHMPCLARLELEIEPEATNRLLATIDAPNCKFANLSCRTSEDPLGVLFTSNISHLFDHMRSGVGTASINCEHSGTSISWEGSWRVHLAGLHPGLAKRTLHWLRALPEPESPVVSLNVTIGMVSPEELRDFLALITDTEGLHRIVFASAATVARGLQLLATGNVAEGSTHGPFPDLKEMWIEDSIKDDSWECLVGMLRRRLGEADARDGAQPLKPLRKLKFGAWNARDRDIEISHFRLIYWPNRLEEVRRLLGPEGELVWYGRTVTEDGYLERRPSTH